MMTTFAITDLPANMQTKIAVVNDCWIWTGAKNAKGYGSLRVGSKSHLAHRWAYTLLVGEIPAGLTVDHTCRVPACVNPAHLEPVTNAVNIARRFAAQTHCKRGHELSGANLRLNRRSNGRVSRVCGKCAVIHNQLSLARRKEHNR